MFITLAAGCGCFICGEGVKFLSGSPGKSGSGSVDYFPDIWQYLGW